MSLAPNSAEFRERSARARAQPPSAARERLRWQRNVAQNLRLERELGEIVGAFADARLGLIVIKGIPLTRRLHGNLAGRYSVDNDLLVRRDDVLRAEQLLADLGYVSSGGRSLADDLASDFQHPMRKLGPDGGTLRAELHWHAFPPELFAVPERALWEHAVPYQLRDRSVLVFDEAMTLLHLASHHVQHRCAEAKVLDDVGAAWQRFAADTDDAELAALARRYGLCGALAFSLDAAHQAGKCRTRSPISSLRAAALGRLLPPAGYGAEPSYAALFGSLLLASPSKIGAAIWRELFPPLSVLARVYGVKQTPSLYLRYPLRLLRPAQKWVKRAFLTRPR